MDKLRQNIRQQHFLAESVQEAEDTLREIVLGDGAFTYLLHDGGIAHDGAGDKLREKGDIQPQIRDVALRRNAAVNVYDIAHRLEGEEGNAYRQGNIRLRDEGIRRWEEAMQRSDSKVEVFEHKKQRDIRRKRCYERRPSPPAALFLPVNDKRGGIVEHDGRRHDEDEARLSPSVEKKTRCEQPVIARAARQDEAHRKRHGEKEE